MAVKTWRKWTSGLHGCRQAAYGVPEMQTRCQRRGLSVLFSLFGSMVQTRQHSSNHLLESYVTSFLACPPRKGVPSFAVLPEGSSSSILGGSFTSPDRGSKVRRNQSQAYCGRQLQRLLPHPESRLPRAPHHANTSLIYKYCSLAHTVLHLIILSAAYLSAKSNLQEMRPASSAVHVSFVPHRRGYLCSPSGPRFNSESYGPLVLSSLWTLHSPRKRGNLVGSKSNEWQKWGDIGQPLYATLFSGVKWLAWVHSVIDSRFKVTGLDLAVFNYWYSYNGAEPGRFSLSTNCAQVLYHCLHSVRIFTPSTWTRMLFQFRQQLAPDNRFIIITSASSKDRR